MVSTEMREEILRALDRLSPDAQARVLDFARTFGAPPGASLADWAEHARSLPPFTAEDADELMRAIEEDCETVDPDGW